MVTVRNREAETRLAADSKTVPPGLAGQFAQYVTGAFVALAETGADQRSLPEAQFLQVIFYGLQVLIVQLFGEHAEEPGEALRLEAPGVLISDRAQLLQPAGKHLQHLHGPVKDRIRGLAQQAEESSSFGRDRRDSEVVELPHHAGLPDGIGQDVLPVSDRFCARQAVQHRLPGHVQEEVIPGGHRRP